MKRFNLNTISRISALALATSMAGIAQAQPIGDWYGTMSNFAGPRQAKLHNGVLTISPATDQFEAPIAVFGDVRTMGFFANTSGAKYDLNGVFLGTTYTHPGSIGSTSDGTTDGTFNYTVVLDTGDVYRLDRDWQNPTFMFNAGNSSQGGITYDCATSTMWVANEGGCQPSGQCGITGSVSNYALDGTVLSSTVFGGSGLLNDLAIDVDGTFWAHVTSGNGDELVHYTSSGLSSGSYLINLGGDTIRGAEISGCMPEPTSLALLALAGLGLLRRRRRA